MGQWHERERLGVFCGYKLGVSAGKKGNQCAVVVRIPAGLAPEGEPGTRCGQLRTGGGCYRPHRKRSRKGSEGQGDIDSPHIRRLTPPPS